MGRRGPVGQRGRKVPGIGGRENVKGDGCMGYSEECVLL